MTTAITTQSICARIVERLVDSVGKRRYEMWFGRSAKLDYEASTPRLEIVARNRFIADRISRHFLPMVRDAARDETGEVVAVSVQVDPDRFSAPAPEVAPRTSPPGTASHDPGPSPGQGLRYRLESFVVGTSNELAYSAAMRLVDSEDDALPGPLFLHGGCGLGKTHLLQGICARMTSRRSGTQVHYTTAEQFTNDFLAAVRTNRMERFRHRMRRLDLLAVDDVHFLANKQATQEEFIHSFDAIQLGGSRVVLASDNHPRLIRQFSERLISRCMNGLVVEVHAPDTETRIRIIRSLAADRGLSLVDGVIATLAQHCRGSVREIEGTLTRLHALSSLARQRVGRGDDLQIGHTLLHRLFQGEGGGVDVRPVRFGRILESVCERLHVTAEQVQGKTRQKQVVLARALITHLARRLTTLSFPEIAAQLNRRSHSTVVSAARRTAKQLAENAAVALPGLDEPVPLRAVVDTLQQAIQGR